jgi:hypothetical protein
VNRVPALGTKYCGGAGREALIEDNALHAAGCR